MRLGVICIACRCSQDEDAKEAAHSTLFLQSFSSSNAATTVILQEPLDTAAPSPTPIPPSPTPFPLVPLPPFLALKVLLPPAFAARP